MAARVQAEPLREEVQGDPVMEWWHLLLVVLVAVVAVVVILGLLVGRALDSVDWSMPGEEEEDDGDR